MAKIFAGIQVAFAELSSDSKTRILLTKQVVARGGDVMVPRPSAFFGNKGPLPDELTHIVLESKVITDAQLIKKLNCDSISPKVSIVQTNWLIDSVAKSSRLDESLYRIDPKINDSVTNDSTGKTSSSSSTSGSKEPSNKRQKTSGGDSETPMSSTDILKHPIITNPIYHPSLSPAYGSWQEQGSIMYKLTDPRHSIKDSSTSNSVAPAQTGLIAFDMDGTLIKTKSEKKFAVDSSDWKLWDPSIPEVLSRYHKAGIKLAIISNQNGISSQFTTKKELQRKVDSIMDSLGVPMDFICAVEDDGFKKPRTGMWDMLRQMWSLQHGQGHDDSNRPPPVFMYVGDAAGRPKEGSRGKDFADSDLKMALNSGIEFQTPEKFFLNSTHRLHTHLNVADGFRLCDVPVCVPHGDVFRSLSGSKEIVLLIAPPACGKSTFSREFDSALYTRINQDTLRTITKCLDAAKEELRKGMSIVVDNTNAAVKIRAAWIELAKEEGAEIRCVILNTSKEVCFSLAALRLADPSTAPEDRREIKKIVIHSYFKNMEKPSGAEEMLYSRVDEVQWSPVLSSPSRPLSASLGRSDSSHLLRDKGDVTLKLLCSYLK